MCVDYDKHLVILVSCSLTLDEEGCLVSSQLNKNSKLCKGKFHLWQELKHVKSMSKVKYFVARAYVMCAMVENAPSPVLYRM